MIQTYPLKNLSTPLRVLIRPMLFISLGLHGLLLFTPMPSEENKPKPPQEKPVKVTQLPTVTQSAKPSPKPSIVPKQVVPPARPIARPQSTPAIVVQAKPSPTPQPAAKAEPEPTPTASPVSKLDASNPLAVFPVFPGAVAGCLGVQSCFATGKDLATVTQFFEKELPARKYMVTPDAAEAGRKVYQFSRDGVSQYLSLIFDGTSTVYVVAEKPLSLADLQKAVQIPPEFNSEILTALVPDSANGAEDLGVKPELFGTDPTLFFSKIGGQDAQGFDIASEKNPSIDSLKLYMGQTPKDLYESFFDQTLRDHGFQATAIAKGYGGGLLYEVRKGTSKPFYLNLVPTKDGTGTIVVTWLNSPS